MPLEEYASDMMRSKSYIARHYERHLGHLVELTPGDSYFVHTLFDFFHEDTLLAGLSCPLTICDACAFTGTDQFA